MIMQDDDAYMLIIITNQDDLVVYYDYAQIKPCYHHTKKLVECNCEFAGSRITTVYFKSDEFSRLDYILHTLRMSPLASPLSLTVEV